MSRFSHKKAQAQIVLEKSKGSSIYMMSSELPAKDNVPPKRITVTRRMEFDAGHRIPNHDGHCKNLHGHRYVLELTVSGAIIQQPENHEDGMVIDFGILKTILKREVMDPFDHAFIVSRNDAKVLNFLQSLLDHKTVILEVAPTVENIASNIFDRLHKVIACDTAHQLSLDKLRLYETPNCWAEIVAKA